MWKREGLESSLSVAGTESWVRVFRDLAHRSLAWATGWMEAHSHTYQCGRLQKRTSSPTPLCIPALSNVALQLSSPRSGVHFPPLECGLAPRLALAKRRQQGRWVPPRSLGLRRPVNTSTHTLGTLPSHHDPGPPSG